MTARQVVSTASGVATLASLAVVIAKQNGWRSSAPLVRDLEMVHVVLLAPAIAGPSIWLIRS